MQSKLRSDEISARHPKKVERVNKVERVDPNPF
jgi:hypothetical protein